MKRNRMMRIASFLLIAVLATTCAISGTFAKYTSDFTGESNARVAKWSFTVGTTQMTSSVKTFTFDLFKSVNDANVAKETDGSKPSIIAPGTQGSFVINLTNNSEVTASYKVTLSEENDDQIPIEYSTDGSAWKSLTNFNADQAATNVTMSGGTASVTIHWRWAFNTSDDQNGKDTTLGWNGTATVTTTATIHVEQVD